MATYTQTSVFNHTSDAGFRAWVGDFINALTFSGTKLLATSDTGQTTTATFTTTATRPSTNTATGYQIYRVNDTLGNSGYPIYIKIEFGTGASASVGAVWTTVGYGTDGAGNVSNIFQTRTQYDLNPLSTSTSYTTYASSMDGWYGLVFKKDGFTSTTSFLMTFGRSCDSTGAYDGTGYSIEIWGTTGQLQIIDVNYAGLTSNSAHTSFCFIPAGITSTMWSGVAQALKWYQTFPLVRPMLPLCTVLTAEFTDLATFTAKLVGSTSHTYRVFNLHNTPNYNNQSGTCIAFIWE